LKVLPRSNTRYPATEEQPLTNRAGSWKSFGGGLQRQFELAWVSAHIKETLRDVECFNEAVVQFLYVLHRHVEVHGVDMAQQLF
jgi:hypothetical protein